MTIIDDTVMRTIRAREDMAEQIFDWSAIMSLVGEHAAGGWDRVIIKPKLPIDLTQTKAASEAMRKLAQYGFKARWIRVRYSIEDGDVAALEIMWSLPQPIPIPS